MTNTAFTLTFCLLIGIGSSKHIFVTNSELEGSKGDDLVSVVVLYRHGDRSPKTSFKDDPYYNSSYWPEGYGQLLTKGIKRQYQLGQWLRTRYDTFLPAAYSPKDILVYSTDVDRTLMSAQANLAGLYPPTESQIWEEDFLWEPIPVHLLATDDPIFAMNSDCPKFSKLYNELDTTDEFKEIYANHSDILEKLSKLTGMNITSTGQVQQIYDVLYVYSNHNQSYLPDWVDDIDMDEVKYLAGVEFAKATYTEELRRLGAGPFFNYLISHFNDTINNVTDVTKFLMLSGHESTISNVLGGMQVFDFRVPEFASAVIWELRSNAKKEYYINVFYKRNSTDNVDPIIPYNCVVDCPFGDFITDLDSTSVDEATWREDCKITSDSAKIVFSWVLLVTTVLVQLIAK